jgi:hypothetical protein
MGAPLTPDEEDRIQQAWERLYQMDIQDGDALSTEPLEMLNFCTDTIMAIYELRAAINGAWNAANARAFPTPQKLPKGVHLIPLGDPKQLHSILTELFGESANDQNPTDNT